MRPSRNFILRFGAWYFFAIALLGMAISFRYLKYTYAGTEFSAYVYLIATIISHFSLLSFIIYLILFIPVAWVIRSKRILVVYISFLSSIALCLLILDTYVYDLYRFHINGFVLNLVFGGAFTDIFNLELFVYLKSLVVAIVLFVLLFWLSLFVWNRVENGWFNAGKQVFIVVIISFFTCQFLHAWAYATGKRSILQTTLSYPLFYPLRANKLIYSSGLVKQDQNSFVTNIPSTDNGSLNYPIHKLEFSDSLSTPNVLFILLDAWQFEAFNSEVTPNLYTFSKKASQFNWHYSGSNGTRGGIFSLFYGLPPLYWENFFSSGCGPLLIDRALEKGYDPVIFGSSPLTSPEFDKTVFSRVKNLRLQTPGSGFCDRDIRITEDFKLYLDTVKSHKPFFGFLFYDAPHNYNMPYAHTNPFKPYWDNTDFSKLSNDFPREEFYNAYKNTVWFNDSLVQTLLKKIEDKGLLSNTVIVITSDHGQEFNENKHNYWGHTSNFSKYQLQVPLLVYIPGMQPAIYNHFTTHYDIAPTLLKNVFGCKNPMSDYSTGKNLFDTSANKQWHLAGSRDHFAIIENDSEKINTVNFNGTLTITDLKMNDLPDAKPNTRLLKYVLHDANRFQKE